METDSFDLLGDTLISNMSEDLFYEPINPSLIWPQLIQHPHFLGSRIKITSLGEDNINITYQAIVKEISETHNGQMALILKNLIYEIFCNVIRYIIGD